jgi:hypothetical protein
MYLVEVIIISHVVHLLPVEGLGSNWETKHCVFVLSDAFGFATCVIRYNVWKVLTGVILDVHLVVSVVLLDKVGLVTTDLSCLLLLRKTVDGLNVHCLFVLWQVYEIVLGHLA